MSEQVLSRSKRFTSPTSPLGSCHRELSVRRAYCPLYPQKRTFISALSIRGRIPEAGSVPRSKSQQGVICTMVPSCQAHAPSLYRYRLGSTKADRHKEKPRRLDGLRGFHNGGIVV